MSVDDQFTQSYLSKGPPFNGDSHFRDKELVKANGGKWNQEGKKWAAHSYDDLQKLIKTKKWIPVGFSQQGAGLILHALNSGLLVSNGRGEFCFDRKDAKRAKFNKETDTEIIAGVQRTYAIPCGTCGVLLDSRLQFGLECDCENGSQWKACTRCCKPVRLWESCECPAK